MRASQTILITSVALSTVACGRAPAWLGAHRMTLASPGGELPFRLTLGVDGGEVSATIGNGSERIQVPAVELGDALVLRFPHYDSELRLDPVTLDGEWIKRRGRKGETRMQARRSADGPRFALAATEGGTAWTGGRYAVDFAQSEDAAVGEFSVSRSPATWNCEGTFLTTLGDYRYLAGNTDGRSLRLSCFDGAHAFLFHAERDADGALRGDFWSSDSWHEAWTATPDPAAQLADGWALTKWRGGAELSETRLRALDGGAASLGDARFAGRPMVIEVFGSWCPNCHDHGAYMAELHRRYEARGLQVVGVAFEHDEDFARCARQVEAFVARHGADFPIFVGGLSDKAKATASLAVLDRVRSFPTTIFVDRHGAVRGVYQGWSGPATGPAHTRLRQRFEQLVEDLLDQD
ncbi:MAG: TlpA disulfide reductase family protein [Planctomycetota bacterium]